MDTERERERERERKSEGGREGGRESSVCISENLYLPRNSRQLLYGGFPADVGGARDHMLARDHVLLSLLHSYQLFLRVFSLISKQWKM